jgi:trimethylamine--corrinoid protein Co-methyltransferase
MTEFLFEPVSPLQFSKESLDIAMEFIEYGQPICVAPMAMASGTAPITLAGTIAQENAEILAGMAIVQAFSPGLPMMYGGIPHIMDPRTMTCSFGSPEQGIMAIAMAQLGHYYGFPVYINVNLTDSNKLDIQAGYEKMGTLLAGILAGADLFGHAGIVGADQGGSLIWLLADNEAMNYARRFLSGVAIDKDHLAEEVIDDVGPGGNFLAEHHTIQHLRNELWLPGKLWSRQPFDVWSKTSENMEKRLTSEVEEILKTHRPPELDPLLAQELDAICQAAYRELVNN